MRNSPLVLLWNLVCMLEKKKKRKNTNPIRQGTLLHKYDDEHSRHCHTGDAHLGNTTIAPCGRECFKGSYVGTPQQNSALHAVGGTSEVIIQRVGRVDGCVNGSL